MSNVTRDAKLFQVQMYISQFDNLTDSEKVAEIVRAFPDFDLGYSDIIIKRDRAALFGLESSKAFQKTDSSQSMGIIHALLGEKDRKGYFDDPLYAYADRTLPPMPQKLIKDCTHPVFEFLNHLRASGYYGSMKYNNYFLFLELVQKFGISAEDANMYLKIYFDIRNEKDVNIITTAHLIHGRYEWKIHIEKIRFLLKMFCQEYDKQLPSQPLYKKYIYRPYWDYCFKAQHSGEINMAPKLFLMGQDSLERNLELKFQLPRDGAMNIAQFWRDNIELLGEFDVYEDADNEPPQEEKAKEFSGSKRRKTNE